MCAGMHSSYLRALFCTAFLVAAAFTAASEALQLPMSSGHRAAVSDRYGKLPVSFEANKGQTNSAVRFLSRGRGYTLFLTRSEAVLAADRADLTSRSAARQASVLRMKLAGLSSKQEPRGEEQLPGTANYFIGGDPAKWRARVPTYAKVRYSNIYSGIDLVYYGNQRQLEFDFALAPNADPGSIRLRFGEPNRLHLAANGDLVVTTANGVLAFHKPLVYQMVDGHRRPVAGDFALLGKHTVGFRLGSYDRAKALVIDPALAFSTFLGGSGFGGDSANAIAVDRAGNVYVTGQTSSIDFPATQGAYQAANHAAANGRTAFVTKLNPTGAALVFSTYLGGSEGEMGNAIAVDAAGNTYVAGNTSSTDFPVTQGAFQTTNHSANGGGNAFVSKLNSAGTALVYSTYLGGSGGVVNVMSTLGFVAGDLPTGLAIDSSGNAFLTGFTASANFPVTQGAYQTTNQDQPGCVGGCIGGFNAFITELNSTGSALAYSTYLGGDGINPGNSVGVIEFGDGDQANALALDGSANVYVTGSALSYDFPVTAGAFQTMVNSGFGNAFVAKLNMSAASTATTPTVTVTPSSTTLTWAQSQSQALAVAMVAIGGSGNPTPTGTVTLTTGKYSSGPIALSVGSASASIPPATLTTGFNALSVSYSGDSNYAALPVAGSNLVTVGTVTVSVVPSASTINSTQALQVAIAVSAGSGSPTPTGMVTLVSGSYISTTTPLASGSATITIAAGSLLPGVDILEVSYGNGNYAGASGRASVTVSGTSPPAFTVTGTPVTVTPGPIAISTITVTPSGGFTGSVALTAALTSSPGGAQSVPTLSFGGTSPVSIAGAAAGTATLTIGTTPANCAPGNLIDLRVRWYPPGAAALAYLLLFSILRRRRNWRTTLAMLAIIVTLAGGMLACGGGSSARVCPPATTAGTYTVTVTGTSGSTTATGTVALTVQ